MKEQQDQARPTKIVSKHCFFQGRNYFESTTNIGRAKNFCDIVILTPNQLKSDEVNCTNEWSNFSRNYLQKVSFCCIFWGFFRTWSSTSTFCEHGVQSFPGMECLKQAHYRGLWYQNIVQKLIARDQFRFFENF